MSHTNERVPTTQLEDELTTRARIRHAALLEFTAHGYRGASIRGIARAAGVSPGLVQHHFGTKQGLRQACDAYVMEFMRDVQFQMVQRGAPPPPDVTEKQLDQLQPLIDYLIMELSSGSETAAKWFNEITEYTHDALTSGRLGPRLDPETVDTRAIAATQAAMALGVTAFYRNIQQALGIEDQAEALSRVGRARLFLAPDRILGEETRELLRQSLDQYEHSKMTGKPPPRTVHEDDSRD